MNCPNCGKDLPEDSAFCQYCGTRIEKDKTGKNEEPVKKGHNISVKKILIAVGMTLIILVVLYIGTYHVSWHAAASYDFEKADKWLILPGVTELYDPGFPQYVNAGLIYEKGYLQEAERAFRQSNYNIDDSQLTDKEKYNKAKNQILAEDYYSAIETIKPLADKQYLDSSIVLQDAQYLRAIQNATEGYYALAIQELTNLKSIGYPKAEEVYDDIVNEAYDYAVELYHSGEYSRAQVIFEETQTKRSEDYLTLCKAHQTILPSYEDLCNLIGFEDAGELIFKGHLYYATRFMTGSFSGDGAIITTTKSSNSNGYNANWSIPGVPSGEWYYLGGQFYTGGVARFKIYALTQNTVKITVISTNKSYVLARQ